MSTKATPNILLLGGTGRTGRSLLTAALSEDYTITALARNPQSLSDLTSSGSSKLTIIKGTPTSEADLTTALLCALNANNGSITIISTLGQTRATGSPFSKPTSPKLYMTESITALLAAITALPESSRMRIRRLVVMSMFGAGSSFANLHCLIKPVMKYSAMSQTIEDHNALDGLVREQKGVEWVMVRPAMLKEGEAAAITVREDDGKGEGWLPSSVTFESVVRFMMQIVESEGDEWNKKAPVICN